MVGLVRSDLAADPFPTQPACHWAFNTMIHFSDDYGRHRGDRVDEANARALFQAGVFEPILRLCVRAVNENNEALDLQGCKDLFEQLSATESELSTTASRPCRASTWACASPRR